MRVVLPLLTAEVSSVVVGASVFPLETLLTRPRLDQRPVDGEVLVRQQILRALDDAPEEAAGDLLVEQAVPILREDRGAPDRLVHLHPDEPPEQQVVIQLLHQQPLAANRIEDLEQLGAQQALGWDRRPTHRGIQAIELARHVAQDLVDQRANRAERMIRRHALLGGHVTEHRIGLAIVSSHAAHRSTRLMICRSLN